jgi:hypothetical protein
VEVNLVAKEAAPAKRTRRGSSSKKETSEAPEAKTVKTAPVAEAKVENSEDIQLRNCK